MSETKDDDWAGISDEDFASLVSDIEDYIPKDAPIHTIRRGNLWVSDLASQVWCEQKLVYSFTIPVEVEEPVHVSVGKSIHLARELAVQDTVPVQVTSKEDRFAVKLLNILTAVNSFHSGVPSVREVPIFGMPFESGVFVTGIIDELRADINSFELDLVELKTRQQKSLPSAHTSQGYRFQIMLYKMLLQNLIKGKLKKEDIAKHLKLNLQRQLGEDIVKTFCNPTLSKSSQNLNRLLDETFNAVQTLPCENQLFIEYCSQGDGQTFHLDHVEYDEPWFKEKCESMLEYWKGWRAPVGVELDEVWKCNYCPFAKICEWRKKKIQEVPLQNQM